MKKAITIAIMAVLALWWYWPEPVRLHPPGVLAPAEPIQAAVHDSQSWQKGDYTITPLAEFDLTARVLSKKRYRFGREADLSPMDFAVGWGPMSDQTVLDQLKITQSFRWYHWKAGELPIPQAEIASHSANIHLIPSQPAVAKQIQAVLVGEIVELRGFLVKVSAPDGWKWASSLSRTDTGGGSCELVWVNSIAVK